MKRQRGEKGPSCCGSGEKSGVARASKYHEQHVRERAGGGRGRHLLGSDHGEP